MEYIERGNTLLFRWEGGVWRLLGNNWEDALSLGCYFQLFVSVCLVSEHNLLTFSKQLVGCFMHHVLFYFK